MVENWIASSPRSRKWKGSLFSPLLFNVEWKLLSRKLGKKGNTRHPDLKGRHKTISLCKWDNLVYRKSWDIHHKIIRTSKQFEEGCKIKVDSNVRSVFYFTSPSRFARDCPGLNTPRSQRTRDHWLPSCESFLVKLEKFGDDEGVLGRKDRM